MNRRTGIWLISILMIFLGKPLFAQVSVVTADAEGIT